MLKSFRRPLYHTLLNISLALLCGCYAVAAAQNSGKPLVLPVKYDEHRFYVRPVMADGTVLNFFTDTGGGLFIYSDVVERLKIPLLKSETEGAPGAIALPRFKAGTAIPAPLGSGERLFVAPANSRIHLSQNWSGMLGQQWFAGRTWTFDYPNRRLLLRADGDLPKQKEKHRLKLGFKTNSSGERAINFPRIQVSIDGERLDLLFDTGASTELTVDALNVLNDKRPAVRATSFITASTFERWRRAHPRWRVIEAAEKGSGQAMIEVPSISIAGYEVGPAWFTRRADKNFHEYMSQWMDQKVEGALGGNALRHFRITVDYPSATAIFEK